MYLDKAKARFEQLQQLTTGDRLEYHPCTPEDIQKLQQFLKFPIPKAYEEFLLWVGRGDCHCLPYSYGSAGNYFSEEGIDLKDAALEVIEIDVELGRMNANDALNILPEDAIVFVILEQCDSFAFIRASEGDNPPVHYFGDFDEVEDGKTNASRGMQWNWFLNLEEFCLGWINSYNGWKITDELRKQINL